MSKYRKSYASYILKDYNEKIQVYLPGAKTKGTNYDKFRDIGYTVAQQNYLTVNAYVRPMVSGELVFKQLGLVAIGSVKITVKNNDVNLFKLANRIVIRNEEYYVFNDAVGKKMLLVQLDENYSEITLFRKEI